MGPLVAAAIASMTVVAGKIGDSDCEELRKGSLAQPANALSSLAYVAVGIAIAIRVMQRRATVIDRTTYLAESLVYAVCLASVGVGSVLFHGPQPAGSKVLHDLPILLTVVFIVNHDLHLVFARLRHEMATFVGAALVATGLTLVSTDAGLAATAGGVVAVAVLEFVIYRSRRRRVATRRQRQAYVAIIAVAAVAGASWLLGRTGSPLCDPDDAFQFHGLWHAISSLIFGLWWWLAIDQTAGRSDSRQAENAPADA